MSILKIDAVPTESDGSPKHTMLLEIFYAEYFIDKTWNEFVNIYIFFCKYNVYNIFIKIFYDECSNTFTGHYEASRNRKPRFTTLEFVGRLVDDRRRVVLWKKMAKNSIAIKLSLWFLCAFFCIFSSVVLSD